MSEWKEHILKDIGKIVTGKTPPTKQRQNYDGDIPFVCIPDLGKSRFIFNTSKTISNIGLETVKNCRLPKGSVVVSCIATIGQVGITTKDVSITNQQINSVIPDKNYITSDFCYYYFKNIGEDLAQYGGGGSIFEIISKEKFSNIILSLPPLPEQTAIASILSSFDDKIDLLHRQNATLEKMAETLFRQWFVEEAKEEWEVGKLGDIAEVQNGFAFSSKDYVEFQLGHLEVLKMGHIKKGGGLRTDPKKDYVPRIERLKRWVLNKGDIVMAMTDMKDNVVILGVPAMIDKNDNYVLNQRVARIYLKNNIKLISNYLLYIQLKDNEFIQVLQSKANSGVQVNLSTETIKDCDIIVPPLDLQKVKTPIIDNLYFKVESNNIQIRTLTALRDTLLPKLISGEVKIQS